MNISAILVSIAFAISLLQQPNGHGVFIVVVDRESNAGIDANVWIGEWQVRTEKGKATFTGIAPGRHRLAIVADDTRYPIVNWVLDVPQQRAAIFRLVRRP